MRIPLYLTVIMCALGVQNGIPDVGLLALNRPEVYMTGVCAMYYDSNGSWPTKCDDVVQFANTLHNLGGLNAEDMATVLEHLRKCPMSFQHRGSALMVLYPLSSGFVSFEMWRPRSGTGKVLLKDGDYNPLSHRYVVCGRIRLVSPTPEVNVKSENVGIVVTEMLHRGVTELRVQETHRGMYAVIPVRASP